MSTTNLVTITCLFNFFFTGFDSVFKLKSLVICYTTDKYLPA